MNHSDEMRALIHSQIAETSRLHAQQIAAREGTFIERLRYSPIVWAIGFLFASVLCSKYVIPWLANSP